MSDRISVTLITKNRPGFFFQCLSSLICQTFKNWDCIVIDASNELVQHMEETRFLTKVAENSGHSIRFIADSELGITQAWQRGMDESSSELGYRLEDDVILMPDYLEHLYNVIIQGQNIAAVGGLSPNAYSHCTIKGDEFISAFYMSGEDIIPFDSQCSLIENPEPLYFVPHLHGLFVYRKTTVRSVGGFATWMSKKGNRDETDLTLRLYKQGYKLVVNPKALLWHCEAKFGGSRNCPLPEREQMNKLDETVFQARIKQWIADGLQLNIRK